MLLTSAIVYHPQNSKYLETNLGLFRIQSYCKWFCYVLAFYFFIVYGAIIGFVTTCIICVTVEPFIVFKILTKINKIESDSLRIRMSDLDKRKIGFASITEHLIRNISIVVCVGLFVAVWCIAANSDVNFRLQLSSIFLVVLPLAMYVSETINIKLKAKK